MNTFAPLVVTVTVAAALAGLAGCTGPRGVDKALSDEKAKTPVAQGNSRSFDAPVELALRVVAGTFVQKGFAIEQADSTMGFIKASRNMPDPKDKNTNYHITATAYVNGQHSGRESLVTLTASEQTVLHRSGHSWATIPLPIPIPIPTGRTYETVVTGEEDIKGKDFYNDFFAALQQGLANASEFGAPTLAVGSPRVGTAPAESAESSPAPASDHKNTELATAPPAADSTPH
jgi:hypothetical protein